MPSLVVFVAVLALRAAAQGDSLDVPLEGVDDGSNYYQQLHPCPQACDGSPSSNWIMYSSWERFAVCDEPVLLSFALSNPVMDPDTPTKITTCTAGNANSKVNSLFNGTAAGNTPPSPDTTRTHRRSGSMLKRQAPTGCEAARARASASGSKVAFQLAVAGTDPEIESKRSGAASTALKTLQEHFDSGDSPCEETVMFSHHQGVVAGVYIGASFDRSTVASVAKPLLDEAKSSTSTTLAAQLCGAPDRTARHTFGLVMDLTGNITAVQDAVRAWSRAKCATAGFESTRELKDVSVLEDKAGLGPFDDVPRTNGTVSNSTVPSAGLARRADCKMIRVEDGDSCPSLASRCGISGADFVKYNPEPSDLCSSESALLPGLPVCCSSGNVPSVMKTMADDGTCATHQVKMGDICDNLARQYGVKVSEIEKWNDGETWGWYGCKKLIQDAYICVSEGKPPMPAKQKGAICGPTRENATGPDPGKALKDMYPCPLNACCNVWGNCGISGDFCTEKKSATGNPGTSGLQNGCVSSCGMEITNVKKPSSFGRIGYYETWNFNRKCLWQHVENANTDGTYTIMHWAFAEINTNDWTVKIVDEYDQWPKFKSFLGGVKKVISFGGWGYSTEPATYDVLRQAMSPANRNKFATNVAKFLADEGLDGADFDWEYPSNTDIPGAEGQPDDTSNYFKFLSTMKSKLSGTGRTVSIAAPASFWYLKPFPIKQMAEVLDYIVFMTYDLHGQWDAGNQYAIDGCPAGNCVRSHVNLTETTYTLAMITKAGVSTDKIFVGESSYARSFKLAQPGCRGPMCTFLGDRLNSQAAKGRCTDTAGYISNAEINEMIDGKTTAIVTWHDGDSNSDMIIYDFTEWGAYMTPTTKSTRRTLWEGKGFAGTIDWAVDLQKFTDDEWRRPEDEGKDDGEGRPDPLSKCKDGPFNDIEHVMGYPPGVIPEHCVPVYVAEVLARDIKKAMEDYDGLIEDGYDKKFGTYADAVAKGGNSAVREFMYSNGNKYFECDVKQPNECCKRCLVYNPGKEDAECRYCDNKYCGGWTIGCETLPRPPSTCNVETTWFDVSPNCPPDYSKRAGREPATGYQQSINWKLKEDKRALFWADLFTSIGIEEKNIKWEDVRRQQCSLPREDDSCRNMHYDWNFPVTEDYDKDDVLNPKDVVEEAYKELQGFVSDMPKAVAQMQENTYAGSAFDFVDAVSMPIFMVQEAVSAIKDISDTVDKWEEDKRKNTILLFLSAIFFFVPVLGQLAGTIASLANVARVLAMIGAAGTAALDIYSVVDSDGNDPMAIFGLVLAPLAIFDAVQVARAASRARDMSPMEIKKLGKGVGGKVGAIKKISAPFCTVRSAKRSVFPVGALPVSSALNVNPFGSLSL